MNKVFLIGRISQDIRYSVTASNVPYARANIAVNREFTNRKNEDITDFIPVVGWRNNAEYMKRYLAKGSLVLIEGVITISRYENKEKVIVTNFEVTIDRIESLESRRVREERMNYNSINTQELAANMNDNVKNYSNKFEAANKKLSENVSKNSINQEEIDNVKNFGFKIDDLENN